MDTFFLGTHEARWLGTVDVPLFVSRRRLAGRRSLPRARTIWALDSGGFSELSQYGRWTVDPMRYALEVESYAERIGQLAWAAPQDWMCEPVILAKTGLTVEEHQERTVANFVLLRDRLGPIVIPVLQGWVLSDYLRCMDLYAAAGVDLFAEPTVGVGTICRRQATKEAAEIIRTLAATGLRLHAFGMKSDGLRACASMLTSADSMSWSFAGRRRPDAACSKNSCANCLHYALAWRDNVLEKAA